MDVAWKRIVIEATVIVASILIAYSIIAWWQNDTEGLTESISTRHSQDERISGPQESNFDKPVQPPVNPSPKDHAAQESITIVDQRSPQIPEQYRQTIGPVVRPPTFGERFRAFEAEPVDVPWAQAMETGLNDFMAVQGPQSSSVIEFIQCRSTACVIAGYSIPTQEGLDASILGDLRKQSWWEGGHTSSTRLSRDDGSISFVILLDRSTGNTPVAAPGLQ